MESKIQQLINQLKTEGVEKAKQESEKIISDAKGKAEVIERNAGKNAEGIIENAKAESEKFRESSEKLIAHAGRNVVIGVKNSIEDIFSGLIKQKVSEVYSDKLFAELVKKIVDSWDNSSSGLDINVSSKDKKKLEDILIDALGSKIKKGVEVKPVEGIGKGFMAGEKGKNIYFDFTDDGIADMIVEFVGPRIKEILKDKK